MGREFVYPKFGRWSGEDSKSAGAGDAYRTGKAPWRRWRRRPVIAVKPTGERGRSRDGGGAAAGGGAGRRAGRGSRRKDPARKPPVLYRWWD